MNYKFTKLHNNWSIIGNLPVQNLQPIFKMEIPIFVIPISNIQTRDYLPILIPNPITCITDKLKPQLNT